MERLQWDLRKEKRFSRRRGKLNGLKLTIEDNRGKASTYFVPVKKQRVITNRNHSIGQVMWVNRHSFWKIADNFININNPETLIDKKIVLKRGNARIVGIVRNVSCSYKSLEGEPVPHCRQDYNLKINGYIVLGGA